MSAPLMRRGPDGNRVWTEDGIALANRRLSIIDRSEAGAQPMHSPSGRYVVTYNGEIYNTEDLREELPPQTYRGRSDTEVLCCALEHWGVEVTVQHLNGMFAIAVWDRQERCLCLIRDRLGIKPLYWARVGGTVLFASELKALRADAAFPTAIDRDAVAAYLRHNYIPAPRTVYRAARKLRPGHMIHIPLDGKTREVVYWDAAAIVRDSPRPVLNPTEAVERTEALLLDTVSRQMAADVPVGVLLSGGIDSSIVAALMCKVVPEAPRSFSIGFRERGHDETAHAEAVARHLGTRHMRLLAEPGHVLDMVADLIECYDEPFADPSQIPTLLLSRRVREYVTVALSGDGGDELFAGYDRYIWYRRLDRLRLLPQGLRRQVARAILSISPAVWSRLGGGRKLGDKLYKLAGVLQLDGIDLYRRLISQWERPDQVIIGATEHKDGPIWDPAMEMAVPDPVQRMQLIDTLTYLPDDILTKIDRASMSVALEVRVPLLDHRVFEMAAVMPRAFMLHPGGTKKWLLRQVLGRHVPLALVNRPKMGFSIPLADWLRGPLRDWAESLLDETALRDGGLLDPIPVRALWQEHLGGSRNHQYHLWTVLMLITWQQRWA